jgi:hypothetical protein
MVDDISTALSVSDASVGIEPRLTREDSPDDDCLRDDNGAKA